MHDDQIQVAIHRHNSTTRVLATAGPGQTLLKARLAPDPWHHRALPSLLEALAFWQKQQVHAVLVAGGPEASCDTGLFADLAAEHARTPLYTLDWVEGHRRGPRPSDRLDGVGDFRDLRQLMLWQVAR
jgi:hypothetical protein